MKKKYLKIKDIPSVVFGSESDKLFVAVHGSMSNKEDTPVLILAEKACKYGYQVIGFDLPEHGDRKSESGQCKVQNCVEDLNSVMAYANSISDNISLFACSIGAYFSLLAYNLQGLRQALFLSPVVDMEQIIENLMKWSGISQEKLKAEKEILTPFGQTLYWDYYCYVKEHPVKDWEIPTRILYGSKDELCNYETISSFSKRFNCNLKIMKNGEHFFHTEEQLDFYKQWLEDSFCDFH